MWGICNESMNYSNLSAELENGWRVSGQISIYYLNVILIYLVHTQMKAHSDRVRE
jgi:hypothetical protein